MSGETAAETIRMTHDQAVAVREAIKADSRCEGWYVTIDDIGPKSASILLRHHSGNTQNIQAIAHEIAKQTLGADINPIDITARLLPRPPAVGGTRGSR